MSKTDKTTRNPFHEQSLWAHILKVNYFTYEGMTNLLIKHPSRQLTDFSDEKLTMSYCSIRNESLFKNNTTTLIRIDLYE